MGSEPLSVALRTNSRSDCPDMTLHAQLFNFSVCFLLWDVKLCDCVCGCSYTCLVHTKHWLNQIFKDPILLWFAVNTHKKMGSTISTGLCLCSPLLFCQPMGFKITNGAFMFSCYLSACVTAEFQPLMFEREMFWLNRPNRLCCRVTKGHCRYEAVDNFNNNMDLCNMHSSSR